jgi:hypothetical protein
MEKEFVPYAESLALKKLGFDEPCFGWWFADEEMLIIEKSNKSTSENIVQSPTFSQAFRWFREKHGLPSWVKEFNGARICYHFTINPRNGRSWDSLDNKLEFNTQEEAELACLNRLIEIVKQK